MDKSEFYDFMLSVITDMERQGRYSTAHVYHCALKSAVKYGGHSLHMEDLTPGWLQSYQEYLLRQSLLWNTISTYMRFHGIPFIDLANLRKVDLRNGYLTIRRHKTGMPLSITVDAAAMKLLRRYANNDPSSPYLLNILNGSLSGKEAYKDYQRALRMLNLQLYRLSRVCRLGKRLSSYAARHTWASIAKSCGIAVEVISEALGHASITTTEGYLKQFDNDEIEKANKVIINYIFKK